jgi:hypothetical protein
MRCMMLVKSNETIERDGFADESELTAMGKFNEEMMNAGVLLAGEGLHPSSHGARVRRAGGKTTVLDGPFAEAKELIAGYWLIQTRTREEALEWLRRVPVGDGRVELLPLYELNDFPVDPKEKLGGWRDQEISTRAEAEQRPPVRKAGTKRFVLMLKADAITEAGAPPKEEVLSKMGDLMQEAVVDGSLLGGEGLKPSSEGARLRVTNGKRSTVDGPFAESKELVAGYVLLQLPTLAHAVEFAMRWLEIHLLVGSTEGEIEIRELFELEDMPVAGNPKLEGWREQAAALRERLVGA